jgi:hypothetical protein
MVELARDPTRRAAWGAANAAEARARYDIHRSVKIVLDTYDQLLAERAR